METSAILGEKEVTSASGKRCHQAIHAERYAAFAKPAAGGVGMDVSDATLPRPNETSRLDRKRAGGIVFRREQAKA